MSTRGCHDIASSWVSDSSSMGTSSKGRRSMDSDTSHGSFLLASLRRKASLLFSSSQGPSSPAESTTRQLQPTAARERAGAHWYSSLGSRHFRSQDPSSKDPWTNRHASRRGAKRTVQVLQTLRSYRTRKPHGLNLTAGDPLDPDEGAWEDAHLFGMADDEGGRDTGTKFDACWKLPAVNRHSTFRHLVEKAVQESVDAQFYLSMSEGSSDSDAETKREQKPSCPAAKKFETCFQTGSLVSTGTDFQPNGKSDTAAAPDIIPKRLEVVKREHQGDELRDSSYNSLHLGESTDDIFQGQEHGCVDHVISLVKEQFPALGPSHLFSAHDQSVASTPAIASFTSTLTSGGQTEPPSKSDAAAQALAKLATKSFDLPADRLPATPRLIPLNDGINELIPDIVVTGYVVSDGTAYEPSLQPAQTPWIEDSMLSDTDEIDLDLARRFGASF